MVPAGTNQGNRRVRSTAVATSATSAEHRRRLLDGFARVLGDKGLAQVQIADVVREARVSKRTFYECFPDKESAFVALIREASLGVFHAVEAVVEGSDEPWPERIDHAVRAHLGALADDPMLRVAMSRELATLGAQGAALQREAMDRFADLFVRLSREEPAVQALSPDAAVLLVGGIAELIARATQEGRPLAELAEPVAAVIRAVVGPVGT